HCLAWVIRSRRAPVAILPRGRQALASAQPTNKEKSRARSATIRAMILSQRGARRSLFRIDLDPPDSIGSRLARACTRVWARTRKGRASGRISLHNIAKILMFRNIKKREVGPFCGRERGPESGDGLVAPSLF